MIIDELKNFIDNDSRFKKGEIYPLFDNIIYLKANNISNYFYENRHEILDSTYKDNVQCYPPWESSLIHVNSKDIIKTDLPYDILYHCSQKQNGFIVELFIIRPSDRKVRYLGAVLIYCDDNKILLYDESKLAIPPEEKTDSMMTENVIRQILIPLFITILKFCNCKNIIKKCNNYDNKWIVKRNRQSKFPITKYYTLEIDNKTKESVSKHNHGLWSNSLHICRGHFKHYSSAAPLFGHYVGTVWCPQHLKGSEDIGVIKKDYLIND